MMKKKAIFMSVLLLLFSAVSCGEKKSDSDTAAETTTVASETAEASTEDASVADAEEDVEEFDPVEGTAFKKGKIEGNVYTSEYAGIKFTLPEGVEFMDSAELDEMVQQAIEATTGQDKRQLMAKVTDAEVYDPETMTLIDIGFNNITKLHPDNTDMTPEEFLEEDVVSPVRELDVNITEPEKVELGGREFVKVKISEKADEGTYQNLYASRIDDDFILFIAALPGKIGDEAAFEGCFEALS